MLFSLYYFDFLSGNIWATKSKRAQQQPIFMRSSHGTHRTNVKLQEQSNHYIGLKLQRKWIHALRPWNVGEVVLNLQVDIFWLNCLVALIWICYLLKEIEFVAHMLSKFKMVVVWFLNAVVCDVWRMCMCVLMSFTFLCHSNDAQVAQYSPEATKPGKYIQSNNQLYQSLIIIMNNSFEKYVGVTLA